MDECKSSMTTNYGSANPYIIVESQKHVRRLTSRAANLHLSYRKQQLQHPVESGYLNGDGDNLRTSIPEVSTGHSPSNTYTLDVRCWSVYMAIMVCRSCYSSVTIGIRGTMYFLEGRDTIVGKVTISFC